MGSTLIQIALAIAILGGAAVITQLFARAIYIMCAQCGTLNARRRTLCRNCGETLRPPSTGSGHVDYGCGRVTRSLSSLLYAGGFGCKSVRIFSLMANAMNAFAIGL